MTTAPASTTEHDPAAAPFRPPEAAAPGRSAASSGPVRARGTGASRQAGPPHWQRPALSLLLLLSLSACGSWPGQRRSAGSGTLGERNREDPALSGQGRLLASLSPRAGRSTLLLQEQPSGRLLPLGPLNRWTPHHSPSLSRNGRYVALLVQQGERSLPLIWDRASGQLHRLPLPAGQEAERLSLAPDARRLAIEVWRDGRSSLRLFDLRGLLEPDLPAGLRVVGGGPGPQTP